MIRESMRSKAVVALGRVVLSKRERVMALEPYDKGLIGTTLRYPYEVRDTRDYFAEIPDLTPAPELLRLAAHILEINSLHIPPSTNRSLPVLEPVSGSRKRKLEKHEQRLAPKACGSGALSRPFARQRLW